MIPYTHEEIKKMLQDLLEMSFEGQYMMETPAGELDEMELMVLPYWLNIKDIINNS